MSVAMALSLPFYSRGPWKHIQHSLVVSDFFPTNFTESIASDYCVEWPFLISVTKIRNILVSTLVFLYLQPCWWIPISGENPALGIPNTLSVSLPLWWFPFFTLPAPTHTSVVLNPWLHIRITWVEFSARSCPSLFKSDVSVWDCCCC